MPPALDVILESVARLTAQRDRKSLDRALVETVAKLVRCEAAILLRMPAEGGQLEEAAAFPHDARQGRLELCSREPGEQRVRHDKGIDRCLAAGEVVAETSIDASRCLFPLEVNRRVVGVLAIYGNAGAEGEPALIRAVLRILGNFLAVLDDNEQDALTGLLNRRTFDTRIAELLAAADEAAVLADGGSERRKPGSEKSHWLGILDIDHFKAINDTHGHIYGDEVLLLFAGLMRKAFRRTDLLFRYGGEEFIVALAPANEPDALMVFERFRRKVEAFAFPQVGRVTVSIGMVRIDATHEHSTTVVERGDQALYYAKESGRNRTCNYHDLIRTGLLKERRYGDDGVEFF